MEFCACDARHVDCVPGAGGVIRHTVCGLAVECEFSYLEDQPHPATQEHVDYLVCDRHLDIAVDNVSTREW